MLSRRAFVQGTAAVALAGGPAAARPGADARHAALLRRFAEAFLARSPEEATGIGHDVGLQAGLRARLDDRSLAARARDRAAVARASTLLREFDREALGDKARLDHDVARFVLDTLGDLLARPGYVDINLRPSPYVVSQMNGAYYWLPQFIGSRHPIATRDDAAAWAARLSGLAVAIDQESARIAHDATRGVSPPAFVLTRTLAQLRALRDGPPLTSALIAPALAKARAAGLPDMAAKAGTIFRAEIAPAIDRQMAALGAVAPGTVDVPGVWRLPDGDAYYAAALRANTTADVGAEELHRAGLAQCAELAAKLDALLQAQGMRRGTIGERLRALDADARFLVSNDDVGRARVIAAAKQAIADATESLPAGFTDPRVRPLVVERIAQAIEAGAPGAFYSDGGEGAPGVVSLNLKTPSEHPLWRLPTLMHHEAVPGHHFQYSAMAAAGDLPLFRRIVRFSAYTEGWALYAEQLADELGVYADSPFGRIGLIQSQLFRAARIVVDTGIHHQRWSLARAIDWMVTNAGQPVEATTRELVRYAVYPGQACSFMVGANRVVAAREGARARLGARFTLAGFHDVVLRSGPVPLAVLETATARWSG